MLPLVDEAKRLSKGRGPRSAYKGEKLRGHMEHLSQITSTKRDGSTYQCKRRVQVVEDGRKNHNLQQKEERRHRFELQQ